MMRALRYALDEALVSLWRGRRSGILSTGTIALALAVLGGFLLVTLNLQRLTNEWSRTAEMSVYLAEDVTADQRATIESQLAPGPIVAAREYVSKRDALARFEATFTDLASVVGGLESNPIPASYEVRLQPTQEARSGVEGLAGTLRGLPGVVDVRYDQQWLSRLLDAVAIVRGIGLLLGVVLTLAAALTVANVVRLALYARQDEIEIMRLVGAPQVYIRGPFVVEGVLQGGIGAVVALAVLGGGFLAVRGQYLEPLAAAINLSSVQFLPVELSIGLVLGGMLVGCLGGMVAAWQG